MKKMNKKAVLDNLGGIVIALVGVGLTLVVGMLIMNTILTQVAEESVALTPGFGDCNDNGTGCTAAENASHETIRAISDIPDWLPIIIITLIGALLIGLVSIFRRR